MEQVRWSDLPSGIVLLIAKFADSDIDLLRLRSVCSSWRSSFFPPPRKETPYTFPLNLPALKKHADEFLCMNPKKKRCHRANHGSYNLLETTLYRLSSPIDPSIGWMFKPLETKPNTFRLLIPLSAYKVLRPPPHTIPKHINLLDYHISEISKSYRLQGVNCQGSPEHLLTFTNFDKIITLLNYVADCDFAALGLECNGDVSYWRFGDENWTSVDTKGHKIEDVIFCDGRCYAINRKGVLFVLNSKLQLTVVVASSHGWINHSLVNCDSDLYVASQTTGVDAYEISPGIASRSANKVKISRLNKCNDTWDCVEDLGDKIFLLSHDGSVVVSAKDFQGCKGNCLYLSGISFEDIRNREVRTSSNESNVYGYGAIIYHLDKKVILKMHKDGESRKLYWPPPSWLIPNPSSDRH